MDFQSFTEDNLVSSGGIILSGGGEVSDFDFEFIFDPHDEYFGMTEQQWEHLHGCKVRVKFIPINEDLTPKQDKGEG